MSEQRKIEYVRLGELKPDPRNPKDHAEGEIRSSIERFGMVDIITVDARTGYLVSGHGRAETLRQSRAEGQDAPEGVEVAEDGEWLVPVVTGWASRTDTESGAALIALNRTTELGGWDQELLLAQLTELEEADAGFAGVGFGEKDMRKLQKSLTEATSDVGIDTRAEVTRESSINADGSRGDDSSRLMVVSLPAKVYQWAQDRLTEGAKQHGVKGNARAFLVMLGEHIGQTTPSEYIEDAESEPEEWE